MFIYEQYTLTISFYSFTKKYCTQQANKKLPILIQVSQIVLKFLFTDDWIFDANHWYQVLSFSQGELLSDCCPCEFVADYRTLGLFWYVWFEYGCVWQWASMRANVKWCCIYGFWFKKKTVRSFFHPSLLKISAQRCLLCSLV